MYPKNVHISFVEGCKRARSRASFVVFFFFIEKIICYIEELVLFARITLYELLVESEQVAILNFFSA